MSLVTGLVKTEYPQAEKEVGVLYMGINQNVLKT